MSNTRIIDMQQKQILRLYGLGYSQRRISRELGIHRKTIKGYIGHYKRNTIELCELIKPEVDLVGPLSLEPPKEPDKRYEGLETFLDSRLKERRRPGFNIDNLRSKMGKQIK